MAEIALLVEAGLVQAERVDNVKDLRGGIFGTLLGFLGGGVGTNVYAGG